LHFILAFMFLALVPRFVGNLGRSGYNYVLKEMCDYAVHFITRPEWWNRFHTLQLRASCRRKMYGLCIIIIIIIIIM
jgi:hypothetical protein